MTPDDPPLSRRDLLKSAAVTAAGLQLGLAACGSGRTPLKAPTIGLETMMDVPFERHDVVRLGIVGVGERGTSLLSDLLAVEHLRVTAVCDIIAERCSRAAATIEKAGQPAPAIYAAGERDFERLSTRDDVDFIYIATPWDWHLPQIVSGLENGKHVGVEVPAVYTLEDCWTMIEASERARRHCVLMENCCYDYAELLVLNVVKSGLLGELIHGECAYNHDLREVLFDMESEGLWRRRHHTFRDGNLYPTHGLGPMANYLGIHRGDRFETLVSMSSGHAGLEMYRDKTLPSGDPLRREVYRCGDYNTSIIKTALGRTILLQHNITTPRPYDRINLIQGTKGIFRDYPPRIYFDGTEGHEWESLDRHKAAHEHRFWKAAGETARRIGGHGGMDYIMCKRLVECMRQGLAPDIDVYDAAAWSAPSPLSERSVAEGSAPVTFPDFTRGRWREPRPWAETGWPA